MKKKVVSLLLVAAMAAAMTAGCGNGTAQTDNGSSEDSSSGQDAGKSGSGDNKITMMC